MPRFMRTSTLLQFTSVKVDFHNHFNLQRYLDDRNKCDNGGGSFLGQAGPGATAKRLLVMAYAQKPLS